MKIMVFELRPSTNKKDNYRLISDNAYYAGMHWSKRKKIADAWHKAVQATILAYPGRFKSKCVSIAFMWNDKFDLDNHSIMRKMIVDSMKGLIIKDDSHCHVNNIQESFHNEDKNMVKVFIMGDE